MSTPTPSRFAGVLAPVFSLRRGGDLGIGDIAALRQLIDWAKEAGLDFIQLLPITETGPDHSPYKAISSVALDPLYLDLSPGVLGELSEADIDEAVGGEDVLSLRGARVDYGAVRRVKGALLRRAFDRFWAHARGGAGRADFEKFRRDEAAWLEDYTLFRWLMELADGSPAWDQWPSDFNTPEAAREFLARQQESDPAGTEQALAFRAWVQWVAFNQWRRLRAYADQRRVRLIGDVPIGVSYHSADAFFRPEIFQLDWSGGSPPETAFREDPFACRWGQNWGVPLYDWDAMEKDEFTWWRQRIRKTTEVFHVFRVDHILGFYRQYAFPWRPEFNDQFLDLEDEQASRRTGGRLPRFFPHEDETPQGREANLRHGDHLISMVQKAAAPAEVVGEDLGTVPPYVRPHLLERGIPGFKIPQWEEKGDFPECSFATYATHDLPPVRAILSQLRERLENADPDDLRQALVEWGRLARFAGIDAEQPPPYSDALKWRLLEALFACPSRYVAVLITDLFGLRDRFNTPGTTGGDNWRVRLPWSVRQLREDPILHREARRLRELGRSTGRS